MSDNELRNQHARHYAGHGYAVGIKNESFKAGWNAAREQEPMVIYKLEKERDQLRAEVEHLRHELWNRIPIKIESPEYNELKAQCEKLAEALEFYAGLIPHAEAIGLGEPNREMGLMPAKFGTVLTEALAEYRKTKGE